MGGTQEESLIKYYITVGHLSSSTAWKAIDLSIIIVGTLLRNVYLIEVYKTDKRSPRTIIIKIKIKVLLQRQKHTNSREFT